MLLMQEPTTSPLCAHVLRKLFFCFFDETLQIINKPKHPKKWEYKEQNERTHIQEDKKEPPKRPKDKGNMKLINCIDTVTCK